MPTPTPQQQAIITAAGDQQLHLIVEARAGTGKTTTLLQLLSRLRGSTTLQAFNKSIAKEINQRIDALPMAERLSLPSTLDVSTCHAAGLRAYIRNHGKKPTIQGGKLNFIQKDLWKANTRDGEYFSKAGSILTRLVSAAKNSGFGIAGSPEHFPSPDEFDDWLQLLEHFGLDLELESLKIDLERAVAHCQNVLRISNNQRDLIDFDDMIYLPLLLNHTLVQYSHVLIDEAQDISSTRREMAFRMLAPSGRIIAVGDEFQAIYGFCHPAGTPVRLANGDHCPIEQLAPGTLVLASNTSGEVMARPVTAVTRFDNKFREHLRLTIGSRTVTVTPHHKLPVRFGSETTYYTYLMVRNGIWRVGSCKAYNEHGFMLNIRMRQEKCQHAWIVKEHYSLQEAREYEKYLLRKVKGTTFSNKTDKQVAELPDDYEGALDILAEHGRMSEFPFLSRLHSNTRRVSRSGVFIIEACNLLPSMRGCFYSTAQAAGGKHGQRQSYDWQHIHVEAVAPTEYTWGITIVPASYHPSAVPHPLYFAGDDILVHNTGADAASLHNIGKRAARLGTVQTLPLTTCWRCDAAIIEAAQLQVPDIEAKPGAAAGTVTSISAAKLVEALQGHTPSLPGEAPVDSHEPQGGDAILCRLNKPNVAMALTLIRSGRRARIEGRDLGQKLLSHVKNADSGYAFKGLAELIMELEDWGRRQANTLAQRERHSQAELLLDEVDCAVLLMERCLEQGMDDFDDLSRMVNDLFGEDVSSAATITLSSVHKAKGREWPRVFILGPDDYMPFHLATADWELQQEQNLIYVAKTRAAHFLCSITGVKDWLDSRREG